MNDSRTKKGKLFIVPTPIGNLKDITLRALDVLKDVDIIATEDTRTCGKLLKLLGLPRKELVSYYDSVETEKSALVLSKLNEGLDVALVSEAGTPLISDPGYKLVRACIEGGFEVIPLPGATAFVPALVGSGLPPNEFKFFGFPPKKKGYKKFLENVVEETSTAIVYVSSHKIKKFINDLSELVVPERRICICREITKFNEQFVRGNISEIVTFVNSSSANLKGEFVVVLEGKRS
ncbi:16S rRNA (cytidine(1402)-2'-O)-methyltransferase [Bacteroidetes/Chlorobi group bacterium Naka2016]|jgi:16S rRNA (cytidine1402-2'-O)-methyltransferase|nr:MAG: 16S rRNA (cytidine(1402)-2'-O)-methyltransferase [Bacteroidetes/Chlorobi group bacterium Naka2016]